MIYHVPLTSEQIADRKQFMAEARARLKARLEGVAESDESDAADLDAEESDLPRFDTCASVGRGYNSGMENTNTPAQNAEQIAYVLDIPLEDARKMAAAKALADFADQFLDACVRHPDLREIDGEYPRGSLFGMATAALNIATLRCTACGARAGSDGYCNNCDPSEA